MQELSSRVGFAAGCGYDGVVAAGVVAARVAHVPGSALAAGGDGRPGNWLGWRMGSLVGEREHLDHGSSRSITLHGFHKSERSYGRLVAFLSYRMLELRYSYINLV